MKSQHVCRWGLGVAVAGVTLTGTSLRAGVIYGYAEQTITGLTVGDSLSSTSLGRSSTSTSAAIDGTGISTNNATDAQEAYLGAAPAAPQNDFTKYSTAGGGPQAGDFTRGDVSVTGGGNLFTTGVTASGVSESAAGGTTGLETSSSDWQVSGSFSASPTSSVIVRYGYANDLTTLTTSNPADASFGVSISVKDQHGHLVTASPSELNSAFSSPPNGPERITSGTSSVTLSLAGLTGGDTYTISIHGTTSSSVSAPVPEPASVGLIAAAGMLLRRRRAR